MLAPEVAFQRLIISGPFDDPDHIHYPYRWYFDSYGVLSCCAWRSPWPTKYPNFIDPRKKIEKEKSYGD